MQLACEGHPQIASVTPGMQFVRNRPTIRPDPVLTPGSDADGVGTGIYGSVIRDGGIYRMWFQAVPASWDGTDDSSCVESDDGLTWRRPTYGVREVCGSKENHLTDLPFHCPSVFIDPTAPDSMRYRAFGWAKPKPDNYRKISQRGYFTAHSADGVHWDLDPDKPVYKGHDVITSTWDPYTNDALVVMKRIQWIGRIPRRTFRTSHWTRDSATEPIIALVPDEFDDPQRTAILRKKGIASIGLVTWPTNRLLGFQAPLTEAIELSPVEAVAPDDAGESSSLALNVTTEPDGAVRVAMIDRKGAPIDGYSFDDCDVIAADQRHAMASWKGRHELPQQPLRAKVEITRGTLWAFDFG